MSRSPSFAAILASARRGLGDIFVMRKVISGYAGGATIPANPTEDRPMLRLKASPALLFGLLLASAASFATRNHLRACCSRCAAPSSRPPTTTCN